jgi:hypothetical protein
MIMLGLADFKYAGYTAVEKSENLVAGTGDAFVK